MRRKLEFVTFALVPAAALRLIFGSISRPKTFGICRLIDDDAVRQAHEIPTKVVAEESMAGGLPRVRFEAGLEPTPPNGIDF